MSRSNNNAPRRPATKLPHLQKKIQKQGTIAKGVKRPVPPRTRKDA